MASENCLCKLAADKGQEFLEHISSATGAGRPIVVNFPNGNSKVMGVVFLCEDPFGSLSFLRYQSWVRLKGKGKTEIYGVCF